MEKTEPAVTARKSFANPNHILWMIDGKPYTMLKRHLAQNGLTPAEYRERYDLPADYPMTSKNYRERRRELAHSFWLVERRPLWKRLLQPPQQRQHGSPVRRKMMQFTIAKIKHPQLDPAYVGH